MSRPLSSHSVPPSLDQQLNRELELLRLPEAPWMPRRTFQGHKVLDVAIIGAGMAGLAAAAALKFLGIVNTRVYDSAPVGAEGPWATHARMQTLRSPKDLAGPALGVPSLTFRAWYTHLHGEAAWEALDRIPRLVWHDYLQWYRQALELPVHNRFRLLYIESVQAPGLNGPIARLEFDVGENDERRTVHARHVVLATGMDGLGGANIPAEIRNLDRRVWRHSSEIFDFSALASRRVSIVGGGDSALDAAATALEAGAAEVDIYVRDAGFTQINYWKAFTHAGHRYGYSLLIREQRAEMLGFLLRQSTPPARGTLKRLRDASNLRIHFGREASDFRLQAGTLAFRAGEVQCSADFLILATGYKTDLRQRPELHGLLPHIRFFEAGALDGRIPEAARTIPELAADFSFRAATPDGEALLAQVHCFTGQALLSVGKICGDIPGISAGAQGLAQGIAAKLYQAEHAWQRDALRSYDEQEITDDALHTLYTRTAAPMPPSATRRPHFA